MPPKLKISLKTPIKHSKTITLASKVESGVDLKDRKKKRKQQTQTFSISSTRISRLSRNHRHGTDFQIRKSLKHYIIEDLENLNREIHFQRVYVLAHNRESLPRDSTASNVVPSDIFLRFFRRKLHHIIDSCDKKRITNDTLTGLFICMETYTYLMVEGAEHMLGDFFQELCDIEDVLWQKAKIFLVENHIGWPHFGTFLMHTSDAINVNEKFPPATTIDASLMVVQHVQLEQKVKSVVETLMEQQGEKSELEVVTALPPDPYNKLLPEVQRIDLCLNADKFYFSLQQFTKMYFTIPFHPDHDALFWPIESNYTPMDIFKRSPYDINLTFSDYGKEDSKEDNERDERPSLLVDEILQEQESINENEDAANN